jgi:hypothetical protein
VISDRGVRAQLPSADARAPSNTAVGLGAVDRLLSPVSWPRRPRRRRGPPRPLLRQRQPPPRQLRIQSADSALLLASAYRRSCPPLPASRGSPPPRTLGVLGGGSQRWRLCLRRRDLRGVAWGRRARGLHRRHCTHPFMTRLLAGGGRRWDLRLRRRRLLRLAWGHPARRPDRRPGGDSRWWWVLVGGGRWGRVHLW